MKIKLLFISILFIALNNFAQTTPCGSSVNDTFDTAGVLPSEWTEYNTTGRVTVEGGKLKFNHNITKPSAYRTFTSITNNVSFSFDVSASRSYSSCQINLVSATGQYLSTIDVGSSSSSIKYATTISSGTPGGFTDGSPKVTLVVNTTYTISAYVNFTTQTIDFYADGVLMTAGVPFLESASNLAKIDIQSLFMYNSNGQFYFDNITLSVADENRLLLANAVTSGKSLLDSAVIGTAGGEYSQSDYNLLETAINTATVVVENCSASQSEITQATTSLNTAITNFQAASMPFVKSVSINASNTKQKIVLMGGDMERNAPALLLAPNKSEIVDWLVKDIPFNTFRVKYDKLQEMTEGVVDLDGTYAEQVLSMKMLLAANPDIKFFATMKSDYHGYNQGNRNNLPTFIYDESYDSSTDATTGTKSFDGVKYGRFLADYIEYMSVNNVPITYLSTSKEWSIMTATRAKATIESLISNLASRNIAMPLIVDAGSWSLTQGITTVNTYISNNVDQYVYGYGAHKYGGSDTWPEYVTAVKKTGKIGINDESSHGGGGQTTEVEVPITNALSWYTDKCNSYEGGIQGELFFEVWMKNNNFNKYYARPIVFTGSENGRRMRSYYIMKKFAENAVDATYVSQTLSNFDNVASMAFVKDNKMVLWMINSSETAYSDFSVNINNFGLKEGMKVERVNWDDTAVIEGAESDILANA
ncbi:MAG: hypothetical protein KBH29_04375, partial [Lutibacter sp.]|nr:hypothetical protein [Lutibacter sp.]